MKNLSVKVKLFILLLFPLLLYAINSIYLLQFNKNSTADLIKVMQDTTNQPTSLVLNADRDMYQALVAFEHGMEKGKDVEQEKADFLENAAQAQERVAEAEAILYSADLLMLAHDSSGLTIGEIVDGFEIHFAAWVEHATAVLNGTEPYDEKMLAKFDEGREELNQFGEILQVYATEQVERIHTENDQNQRTTLIFVSLIIVLIALSGFLMIRQLTASVWKILNKVSQVAEGRLDAEAEGSYAKDEMGRILEALDGMIKEIRQLVGGIKESAQSVAAASKGLTVSSNESSEASSYIAENTQEVTAGIEAMSNIAGDTSKAIHEMAAGVQRIAESTALITESSVESTQSAHHGQHSLQLMSQQIHRMVDTIQSLSQVVDSLTLKSEQIGKVAVEISEFANQTNILSLNASIESARAGEHGKGFGVVASEIRKLAFHSLNSAEGITKMIEETQQEIATASTYMKDTLTEANKGNQIMDEVNGSYDKIHRALVENEKQVLETSAITEQLSASSQEIAAGMEQAAKTTKDIYGMTQNVAASTEEQLALVESIADSAGRLEEIVGSLNQAVSKFSLK